MIPPVVGAIIGAVSPALSAYVKSRFPDPEKARQEERELIALLLQHQGQIGLAAADIIKAEAQSEHWLTACWRPVLMLTFGGLIVARWLGWSAPGLSEAEVLKLWDIVQLGIGGYTIGRSVEKVAPTVADALAGRRDSSGYNLPYKG